MTMASDSPISALQAQVLPVWESLRSKATDPRPAYFLSGICMFLANPGAAALPFGFAHASLNAHATYKIPRLVPPFWQLAGFGALFATGGYIIGQGDTLNGSGVITGALHGLLTLAWSLTYATFKTLPTLPWLWRSPISLALSTAVLGIGIGVYGNYYFDKASWRGAIPGLMPKPNTKDK